MRTQFPPSVIVAQIKCNSERDLPRSQGIRRTPPSVQNSKKADVDVSIYKSSQKAVFTVVQVIDWTEKLSRYYKHPPKSHTSWDVCSGNGLLPLNSTQWVEFTYVLPKASLKGCQRVCRYGDQSSSESRPSQLASLPLLYETGHSAWYTRLYGTVAVQRRNRPS